MTGRIIVVTVAILTHDALLYAQSPDPTAAPTDLAAVAQTFRSAGAAAVAQTFRSAVTAQKGKNEPQKPKEPEGVRFEFKKPPSLRFGDAARIDFRFKLHSDYRSFSPDLRREDPFDLRRTRVGVEGTVARVVQYEVEYDFRERDYPWRDAFVDLRAPTSRVLQVRAGKFKLPFSREELTGAANLDFSFRSRAADQLSPGRDLGVMAHGRLLGRRLSYQAGVFRQDGENARPAEPLDPPATNPLWAARAVVGRLGAPLNGLELGVAMTSGIVPEGRNGLRGRMVLGGGFFAPLEVNGRRQRLGLEAAWARGPLSLQAEFMRARDERRGQGLEGEDLPAVIARGWYVAGTWLVAGRKPGGDADKTPRSPFGGVEVAARYEGLRFGSQAVGEEPSRSPRAAFVVPNENRAWTFGANWYVNEFIRIQGNAIRERLEDAFRGPIRGQEIYWSGLLRFQFVL